MCKSLNCLSAHIGSIVQYLLNREKLSIIGPIELKFLIGPVSKVRIFGQSIKVYPRRKHGRAIYNLEGNAGVTTDEIRERFGVYYWEDPVKTDMH